jgi:hypothetical protein
MRFLVGLGNIFVFGGLVVFSISAVVLTNEALQRHPFGFLVFWTFIPVVSWWLAWGRPGSQLSFRQFFTRRALKTFISFLIGSVFLLSLLILLNWENIRDKVGKRYVQGYFATHDFVYAEHWYAERAMWLFEVVVVLAIFAFPAFTLTLTQTALDSHEEPENDRPKKDLH